VIKILARGKPESEKFYQMTCDRCGCIFAFQRTDVNYEDRPCGNGYVDCPQDGCSSRVGISLYMPVVDE